MIENKTLEVNPQALTQNKSSNIKKEVCIPDSLPGTKALAGSIPLIKSLNNKIDLGEHKKKLVSPIYKAFKGRSNLVIFGDWEFQSKVKPSTNPQDFYEATKVKHQNQFVIGSFYAPHHNQVRVYEHPTLGYGKIGTWKGETVFTDYIKEAIEVSQEEAYQRYKGEGQIKGYEVCLAHFFSAFDVFGCFKSAETQQYIASQLEGGRVLHGKGFQSVRTGVFYLIKGKGYELTLKIVDFKGYAPTGGGGTLEGTFKSQGMTFENKALRQGFDISKMADCYMNEDEMRIINGVEKTVSDWVIEYTMDDGTYEMFEFLFLIHNNNRKTIDSINPEYQLEYARTLGNIANQAGLAALSKQLGYNLNNPEDRYNMAFLQYLSSAYNWHSKDTTNNFLIATAGGMCKNFQPRLYKSEGIVIDIDWKGFYPSIMKVTPYCVGVPIVIDFHKNEIKDAGETFDKHRTVEKLIKRTLAVNLVPRAWKARITTKQGYTYKFRQNLILSFMVGESCFDTDEKDEGEIPNKGKSRLRSEIPKGAITLNTGRVDCAEFTSDYMEYIDNYWTPRERKEFYENTLVDAIIFYDAQMEVSPSELRRKYERGEVDLKRVEVKVKKGKVIRTHVQKNYWCRLNTNKEWLGILDDKRSKFKALRSEAKKLGDREAEVLNDALQNSCKTINNGTAGVSMSGDYQTEKPTANKKKGTYKGKPKIGNVVFGSNVTAAGRVATYCLATVSRGHQIITDGCPSNLNKFMSWDWEVKHGKQIRRIGADALYALTEDSKLASDKKKNYFKNNVKIKPLLGKKWTVEKITYSNKDINQENPFVTITNSEITGTLSNDNCEFLNPLIYESVAEQFENMSIFRGTTLKIEIKNVYQKAVFQSQANYKLIDFAGNEKIKARGYEIKKEVFSTPTLEGQSKEHPFKELIKLIEENKGNPYYITGFQRTLHGVGEHNKTENVNKGYINRGYLPHCTSIKTTTPRPISLSMFYFKTWKQRKLWHSIDESLKNRTGGFGIEILGMSLEQLNNQEYFDYNQTVNHLQDLIDSMSVREGGKDIPEKEAIQAHKNKLIKKSSDMSTLLKEHGITHPNQVFKSSIINADVIQLS